MTEQQKGSDLSDLPIVAPRASSQVSQTVQSLMTSARSNTPESQSPLFSAITVAALELTEATGAALALKTDGGAICLARAGEMAPPLGTVLGTDSGISGECFRTGIAQHCTDATTDPRVDAEASERLGVRSLAVVPLLDTNGVLGILEVFSDHASAFGESHVALLSQLAAIAFSERKPEVGTVHSGPDDHGVAETPTEAALTTQTIPGPVLQDQVRETTPNRSVKLAGFAIAVLTLVVSLGWVGTKVFRSPAAQGSTNTAAVQLQAPSKPTPAGAVLSPSLPPASGNSKRQINPAAGDVVVRASDVHPLDQASPQVLAHDLMASPPSPEKNSAATEPPTTEISSAIAELQKNPGRVVSSIVAPSVQMPANTLPISQGITGGTLIRSIPPTYPDTARRQKIQGDVVLEAVVDVDGRVRDLRFVSGDRILAGAAQQAVSHWRYTPFLLNGKPVSMRTNITIQFKLPR
jgi:TonB family protein